MNRQKSLALQRASLQIILEQLQARYCVLQYGLQGNFPLNPFRLTVTHTPKVYTCSETVQGVMSNSMAFWGNPKTH